MVNALTEVAMRWMVGFRVIAGLCILPGCSSDNKDQVDTLFTSVATELCKSVYNCCEASELGAFQSAFTDQPGCERYVTVLLQDEHYAYRLAVSRGGVSMPGAAVDACLAALRSAPCATFKLNPSGYPLPPSGGTLIAIEACSATKLYVGTRKVGEACETLLDCAPGTYCYGSGLLKSSGVCTPLRKKGEPCQSTKDCETGLVCSHPVNKFPTCQPPAGEGQSCKEVNCDPAQPDLFCDSSKDYRNPICTRRVRKQEGQPCSTTVYNECDKGLYCDYYGSPMSPVCARYRKGGEPCTNGQQCESGRCDYLAKICIGQFCDGKGNGPPPQLDAAVPIDMPHRERFVYPDWRRDIRPPDMRRDWGVAPDLKRWPDSSSSQ